MISKKRFWNGDRGGVSKTIKANYYKMGRANFLDHLKDGLIATAVYIEYEL